MIDHLSYYTTTYEKTRDFYRSTLEALGYGLVTEMVSTWDPEWPTRRLCAFGPTGRPVFWLIEVKEPATPRHVAFHAKSRALVNAFHTAALAAGGKDNGAPGERPHYTPTYYGAFIIDPDGNNIEAVTHTA